MLGPGVCCKSSAFAALPALRGVVQAPFLLSELLTEVIVPLAGTVLTVFVVYAESDSRSCVAQAKTHAAQVTWRRKSHQINRSMFRGRMGVHMQCTRRIYIYI